MNGFEKHGIDHLSPSSLNSAATNLPLWVLERLLKRKAPVGAAAHRGTAIEAGVTVGLLYLSHGIEQCQAIALDKFDELVKVPAMLGLTPEAPGIDKEREAVAPTVAVALEELRDYGMPDELQAKIERVLDEDLPPLIGFIDFGWSRHAITLDLKTSLRLPSEISTAHGRQVAAYVTGTNREGRVAYVTPKRVGVYSLDRVEDRFNELRLIAQRLNRFLLVSADPMELAGLLIPDTGHFFWSHPDAEAARREVYGF